MDLIEREAAIKEIRKYFAGLPIRVHYDMLELVRNLPSAHQWIPVSERLPEEAGDYLVCDAYGNIFSNFFGIEVGRWSARDSIVVAWMPMPPAFKEEEG